MLPQTRSSQLQNMRGKFSLPVSVLRFTVFVNLYITLCALVMSYYTFKVFSIKLNAALLLFAASGTLCSYSFHWLLPSTHTELSSREKWSLKNRSLLFVLFFIGAAGSFYSILPLMKNINALIPMIILTFLYSSGKLPRGPFIFFRKYFIGKTIYLALMWSLVTVYLPVAVSNLPWSISHTFFLINRFFFLFAICILFDLRDKDADTMQGIKSFITILPLNRIKYLYYSSIIISMITGLYLFVQGFSAVNMIVLLLPVFLLVFVYNYSSKTRSELWFYFVLDGFMMLSGIVYSVVNVFT